MGKASENKQQKRTKLLDTAFHLFTTKGFEETSVSDITKEANVGKGTFYLYFKNKQDLEARLISHRAAELFQHAAEAVHRYPEDLSLEDKAMILIGDLLDQLIANPILLQFIYKNLSWGVFRNAMKFAEADDQSLYVSLDDLFGNVKNEFMEPDLMLYTIIEHVSATCYNVILWSDPVEFEVYKLFLDKNIRAIIQNHRKPKR